MVKKNFNVEENYDIGFAVSELFLEKTMGITTGNDDEYISFDKTSLTKKFGLANVKTIEYRSFDKRFINYDPNKLARARTQFMSHFFENNIAIDLVRRSRNNEFISPFVTKSIVDKCIISTLDNANIFPLYLYPQSKIQLVINQPTQRTPNLNSEIINKIAEGLGIQFVPEKEVEGKVCFVNDPGLRPEFRQTFAPIDLLDYIYAVLHSPAYREKYKEFLKIDFPRVPYPKDPSTFWQLVELGGEIRQIHLLESPVVENYITKYPVDGDNVVVKPRFEVYTQTPLGEEHSDYLGAVYINDTQYFGNVPTTAWEFYIGGYQPAQKWLKDRKGRKLEFDDILHYQKIIVALTETARIMEEINAIMD